MAAAEKTPTALTVKSFPDNPPLNHGFHITGQLSTVPGEKLGNKRVTLESSPVGTRGLGNFTSIDLDETGREGEYDFFRPKYSPQEYLRVTYAGNEQYEPASSPVIPVRGAGTITPEKIPGNGSLSVRTDPLGADIYIDSIFNGTTPRVLNLPEGPHVLEVGLAGYQNETMEAYVSPTRESSFAITLNPEGLGLASTGLSSSLSYAEDDSFSFGEPAFSLDSSVLSMRLYTNASRYGNSTGKKAQVTTVVSNDTAVNDGYNVMVIMTDHE